MAVEYSIILPRPAGVPEPLVVRITVMRDDGKTLSREELEALAIAYPAPTAEGREAVAQAIARAPSRAPKAGTKTSKTTPKRAAAKR